MSNKFKVEILELIKREITRAFSFEGYLRGEVYEISNANPEDPFFMITTKDKDPYEMTRLKECLQKKVGNDITWELLSGNRAKLNIEKFYRKSEKETLRPESPEITSLEASHEEEKATEEPTRETEEDNSLDGRDIAVIRFFCEGKSFSDMAHELGMGITEFNRYRAGFERKLKANSQTEVIIYALENGLYENTASELEVNLLSGSKDLVRLFCEGWNDYQIGERMHWAVSRVKASRDSILRRIGGKSKADIIMYALKHKIYESKSMQA